MQSKTDSPDDATPENLVRRTKKTQEQRRNDAEARLLNAAQQIVARKGWVGMTLGEVGMAAGYSRGLATHYFGSKPELLRTLVVYIGENFKSSVNQTPNLGDGFHAVLQFIRVYFGRADGGWVSTRAMLILMAEGLTEGTEAGANLAVYNQTVIDMLRSRFEEAIRKKEIREGVNPESAATALLGTIRGVMLQGLLKNSPIALGELASEVTSSTIYAYARRPQTWLAMYVSAGRS